jgi:RIO-like serine/threonine protein kinase
MKQPPLPLWPRAQLEACSSLLLSRGSRWKPAVLRAVAADGQVRIVKDCRTVPLWSRWVARLLMGRECRIMRRLQGMEGFPVVLERIDRDAFTMEEMPGRPLEPETFRLAPRRIADALLQRAEAMNSRGVYHLDLRQRQNILLGAALEVAIIDFGAAWAPNPLARRLFGRLLADVDRSAALKYLARFAPEQLTRAEAEEVLRGLRRRKLWVLSPYRSRGIEEAVRQHLQDM